MYKVKFTDVGRGKYTGETTSTTEPDYDYLLRQVRPHLLSRDIDFGVKEERQDGSIKGVVFAGFRTVGEFEITREAPNGTH